MENSAGDGGTGAQARSDFEVRFRTLYHRFIESGMAPNEAAARAISEAQNPAPLQTQPTAAPARVSAIGDESATSSSSVAAAPAAAASSAAAAAETSADAGIVKMEEEGDEGAQKMI